MKRNLKNFYHLLTAIFSTLFFRAPGRQLFLIGVTGTDGKTTVVHLIAHLLKTAGQKVAMISTVSAPGLHVTTPHPWILQKFLRKAADQGKEYLVLEATSHGLDQHRLFGCRFQIGVMTNVSHEHLDYHKTYSSYLKAKAKLFKGVKWAVLNQDDPSYTYLQSSLIHSSSIITYGIKKKADLTPKTFPFQTPLLGKHNLYNCLAAIGVAKILGIEDKKIRQALASFQPVKGRLEEIDEGQNFRVFIDFAHTPNGLKNTLKTLRSLKPPKARLIAIFGAAGLRDRAKRPLMGKVAADYADLVVLTSEDPRTEDVHQIIEQIAQGYLKKGAKESLFRLPDRQEAINFALRELAKEGDIVVSCGKGHEKSMCLGRVEHPWSEHQAVKKALKGKNG